MRCAHRRPGCDKTAIGERFVLDSRFVADATPGPVPAVVARGVELTYPARRRAAPIQALGGRRLRGGAGGDLRLPGPERRRQVDAVPHPRHPGAAGARRDPGLRRRSRARGRGGPPPARRRLPEPQPRPRSSPCARTSSIRGISTACGGRDLAGAHRRRAWSASAWPTARGQRAAELSGGLRRRAEIAKALLHAPRLLLLDEPSTGLDPGARRDLWATLEELRGERGDGAPHHPLHGGGGPLRPPRPPRPRDDRRRGGAGGAQGGDRRRRGDPDRPPIPRRWPATSRRAIPSSRPRCGTAPCASSASAATSWWPASPRPSRGGSSR